MAFRCRPMTPDDAPAWDAFVQQAPAATFFHRAAWRGVIEQAFRHRTHYALCERDGQVTGVLPLVRLRSLLFGDTLVSTPFCVQGGPVAADAQSLAALEEHATALLRQTGAAALEFRDRDTPTPSSHDERATEGTAPSGWTRRDGLYVTFARAITGDARRDLDAVPRKQRAMIRKGIANGLQSVQDAEVDRLHRIYAESVRNLGTPTFSRRYFRLLRHAFPGCSDVLTVLDDATPIASVLSFRFRDQVLPYYGGGTAAARGRAANDFLYWEVMRRAGADGMRVFDFGRSKQGTGAYAFKKHWGFEPEPLAYRFRLRPGASLPDINPLNPKYRLMVAAWKRLPLPVAGLLGPHIVRGTG